ncbi:MAG: MlaD family protein [Planctomycetota bacterium]|jgi:phospholipid/cholesterol/gamma-HCH transport system substrate-binding protein
MTDYQTKQKRRNVIVGAFVLVGFGLFIFMLTIFRDLPLFVSEFKSFSILVYFPDAPGIQKDTPIQYCGYQVGRVLKVAPPTLYEEDGNRYHRVGVTMAIDNRFADIPSNVEIILMKRGLGSSYVELKLDPKKPEGQETYLTDEMVLLGSVGMASEFFPPDVQQKLEDLVDSMVALTRNANQMLGDEENKANIKKTLANVQAATAQAEATLESIAQFSDAGVESVQQLGTHVANVSEQLEATLSEFRQMMAKIEQGQGTAGKLINDGRLYENLIESSQELETLLEQLKKWAAETREQGLKIKL